jgi:hypothetical protein
VFVYRDDTEPLVVRLFSQPSSLRGVISEVSMDSVGSSLVFTAEENPGGCPSGGGRQLYLVRDLADPTIQRSTCACQH